MSYKNYILWLRILHMRRLQFLDLGDQTVDSSSDFLRGFTSCAAIGPNVPRSFGVETLVFALGPDFDGFETFVFAVDGSARSLTRYRGLMGERITHNPTLPDSL